MSCIGTAGHVDHGKSTLVKALTGIDPDRLAEEKERGMTIDLGFAWLTLPSGREVSIVDVPGHESFIKNMLAGVGGIDIALLVIAADEGVMPQTREHLAILDLLQVRRGIVALTKCDLVDEEWLALVHEEVQEHLKPTTLAGSPILPVSAYTQQGLQQLVATLDCLLAETHEQEHIARPRLPIDRVFTITGFGTIVTGTLLDGTFKTGQEVEILPQGIKTRIRNLQMHKQQVELAQPGSRIAINLANVARTALERGNVVTLPRQVPVTTLVDARIHLLTDAERTITHGTQVDFYSGSQEIPARVRLLDVDELLPGESAWAQLRLSRAAVVASRDRFILRTPSPSRTLGGGEIVNPQPRYHRRYQPAVLESLERQRQGIPEELVLAALDRRSHHSASTIQRNISAHGLTGYELAEIAKQCHLSEGVTLHILETFLSEGRVRKLGAFWFAQQVWETLAEESLRLVREQHQQYPLRAGFSKEEWRTRLNLTPKLAAEVLTVLAEEGKLVAVAGTEVEGASGVGYAQERAHRAGSLLRLPSFTPQFTSAQQKQVQQLLQRFQQSPYTPPMRAEAEMIASEEVVAALIEQGRLIKLADSIVFLRETYEEALHKLIVYLQEHGQLTVADARDVLGATRKYVLPLLEHMDILRITRRIGDMRVLRETAFFIATADH